MSRVYVRSFFYSPEYMSTKKREDFLLWYAGREGLIFDFKREIYEYCRFDVDIES